MEDLMACAAHLSLCLAFAGVTPPGGSAGLHAERIMGLRYSGRLMNPKLIDDKGLRVLSFKLKQEFDEYRSDRFGYLTGRNLLKARARP
ncbi:hypothetical protein CC85DRAFT_283922 [Cutaneotrichosporon oleaginosum]|uniref:Uncharacterized protein n=1 Tax=Cutaneotrichosporon oleaginosum TaxID=879819 RepID=A0A0J0XST5_9TREE|nr:uncharacterized protein CC85DRAFT_283922 [Cutaneotrichosporon oleaginosum]KLT44133.1 hypothetical protein CC85DRAFT_283922 [Cutaneotrichosporon oleaginosum]TXT09412.1 hypothetical protein COLE_03346 [Cutaneotrichosporon oleaginosum]